MPSHIPSTIWALVSIMSPHIHTPNVVEVEGVTLTRESCFEMRVASLRQVRPEFRREMREDCIPYSVESE